MRKRRLNGQKLREIPVSQAIPVTPDTSLKIVSAGEIAVGIYVAVIEVKVPRVVICQLTGKVTDDPFWTGEHWFKGIPFKVINVNGPIVAVDTNGLHRPAWPNVMFFDARNCRFIECTKEFHDQYVELMRGPIVVNPLVMAMQGQQPPAPSGPSFPFPAPKE